MSKRVEVTVVVGKATVEFSNELHGVSVRGVPLSVNDRRSI
jgi:hypothetical protein